MNVRRLRNLSVLSLVLQVWGLASIFKEQKAHFVWADPSLLSGNKCLGRMPAPLSVMIILSGLILDNLHSSLICCFTEQRWWTWTSTCLQELHETICCFSDFFFWLFLRCVWGCYQKITFDFFLDLLLLVLKKCNLMKFANTDSIWNIPHETHKTKVLKISETNRISISFHLRWLYSLLCCLKEYS